MKSPYFIVHRVEVSDGFALVDGRLGETKIANGYIFNRLYTQASDWSEGSKVFGQCTFILNGIEIYRNAIDELDAGLTARIRLEGEGLSALFYAKILE